MRTVTELNISVVVTKKIRVLTCKCARGVLLRMHDRSAHVVFSFT